MRNDTAASGEFRINLPPDVLAEMRRQSGSPRSAMQVDGFRPGLPPMSKRNIASKSNWRTACGRPRAIDALGCMECSTTSSFAEFPRIRS